MAPSNPSRLYAIVIDTDGTFQDLYRSNDGGDTWTKLADDPSLSSSQSTYGWWFGRLWVDPTNANHVFAAGVELEESTNGGSSWTGQFSMHADQHGMAWSSAQAGLVYLGNDGGVYHSTTNGSSWTHATVEPFTQFYSVDVSEQDNTRLVGGPSNSSTSFRVPNSRTSANLTLTSLKSSDDRGQTGGCSIVAAIHRSQ